jgi:uroporphyrinogen III methyltransferase/synthase
MRRLKKKQLEGRLVLVTRPKGQSAGLARLLRRAGAKVLEIPSIRIRPPADPRPLRDAARRSTEGRYDLLVFTSPNAVSRFFRAAPAARPIPARFAAIGPKTARALRTEGVRSASWPEEHRAEALAAALRVRRGERVLLPRAAVARDVLPASLRRRGARVDVVEAYRTEPDAASAKRLRRLLLGVRPPDWITFTSSSTAESLRGLFTSAEWRKIFRRARAASIGPITSGTLRSLGIRPAAEARPFTAEALAGAILRAEP